MSADADAVVIEQRPMCRIVRVAVRDFTQLVRWHAERLADGNSAVRIAARLRILEYNFGDLCSFLFRASAVWRVLKMSSLAERDRDCE